MIKALALAAAVLCSSNSACPEHFRTPVASRNLAATFHWAARRHHVPPRLLLALGWEESRFHPLAVSRKGAYGVMQTMGLWGPRHTISQQVDAGARALRFYLRKCGTELEAIHGYRSGGCWTNVETHAGAVLATRDRIRRHGWRSKS